MCCLGRIAVNNHYYCYSTKFSSPLSGPSDNYATCIEIMEHFLHSVSQHLIIKNNCVYRCCEYYSESKLPFFSPVPIPSGMRVGSQKHNVEEMCLFVVSFCYKYSLRVFLINIVYFKSLYHIMGLNIPLFSGYPLLPFPPLLY